MYKCLQENLNKRYTKNWKQLSTNLKLWNSQIQYRIHIWENVWYYNEQRQFFWAPFLNLILPFLNEVLGAEIHGEFQLGLKFRTAHRAEILLRLHGEFQPGCNVKIERENLQESVLHAFLCTTKEVHMPKFIFRPGWNLNEITWGFSACLTGLKFPARFHKPSWNLSPGWNLRCNRSLSVCLRLRFREKSGARAEPRKPRACPRKVATMRGGVKSRSWSNRLEESAGMPTGKFLYLGLLIGWKCI